MKVGINGFGRIGKTIFKILRQRGISVTQINDPFINLDYLIYMLKYDSTFGPEKNEICVKDNCLLYLNEKTQLLGIKNPEEISWDVDLVIESSGVFKTTEMCSKHRAPKVCVTAPMSDAPMYVYGVNHTKYTGEKVFSNASCTTNCLAPIAKIINDHFGIEEGLMTTVHAATATQNVVDAASAKDWRSGRGALQNIIPASTGAAKAVGKVIPELNNKLTGMAFRVPVANVSVVDFTFRTTKKTNLKSIFERIETLSKTDYKDIVAFTSEKVVSSDFIGSQYSSIVDSEASIALNDNFFKVISWYDNEYGYSVRVADLVSYVISKSQK